MNGCSMFETLYIWRPVVLDRLIASETAAVHAVGIRPHR
jgi:hypothetical protein